MKKLVIVFALVMFASVAIGQLCMADEKQDKMGPKIKVTKIEKKSAIDYIEFLDYFGNTKKKIKMKHVYGDERAGQEYTSVDAILTKNNEFAVVTNTHSVKNPEQVQIATNIAREDKHSFTLYNEQGDALFSKDYEDLYPIRISENGERVVCIDPGTEYDMDDGESLPFDVYVLDQDGSLVYSSVGQFGSNFFYDSSFIQISPSGNWLTCNALVDNRYTAFIINLETGELVACVDRLTSLPNAYNYITDNGDLARRISESVMTPTGDWKKLPPRIIIEYSPESEGAK